MFLARLAKFRKNGILVSRDAVLSMCCEHRADMLVPTWLVDAHCSALVAPTFCGVLLS